MNTKLHRPHLFATTGLLVLAVAASTQLSAKPFSQDMVRSTSHQIDQLVATHLLKNKVKANPIIDDATFARRAFISVTGRIPSLAEAEQFIDESEPHKRRALVDQLIESPGYKSRMFNFWADLLRLQTNQEKYGIGWHVWIRDAVENNMPYDEFINTMLASEGLATENPAVGYYLRDRNMLLDNVSNTVQVFLGNRIGCAQCHDHPFDDWTQKQYYELAAFTGGTTYKSDSANARLRELVTYTLQKKNGSARNTSRRNKQKNRGQAKKIARDYSSLFKDFRKNATSSDPRQQLKLPDDYHYNDGKPGEILKPQTIFGDPLKNIAPEDRRIAFGKWVTSRDNPYFTKVIVNRLWAQVFGRGIVDPLDDWSETTRVSHPELLELLCKVMKATDYDVKQFMRVLYHTRLFESAAADAEAARGKSYDFHGPLLRRMSAEEMHDSFLVMEFGNRDEEINPALKQRWEGYKQSVEALFEMPLPQLIALDEAADQRELEINSIRKQASKYRTQAEAAANEGDTEKAQQLRKKAVDIFRQSKRREKDSKNATMTMVMQRKIRVKGKASLRASEQPTPYKAGTFMRQFGASDRQTPDAAHTQASIPQALTLLNGREVNQVTDGKGKLAQALRDASSDSQRLEILFLTIYGTRPTDAEQEKYQTFTGTAADLRSLSRAMMNSKRFLFVQ
jgi:hypothetical protein